jgi:aminoglycoside phosphotransferase (APT) family kinase protein
MHADEFEIDESLVRELLESQFPEWADLSLEVLPSSGTDNVMVRLGGDKAVRLPRHERASGQVEIEHLWLPRIAPQLPLGVPEPLALGRPDRGFPWPWSIGRWLEGSPATTDQIAEPRQAAMALGQFVAAMQQIDLPDGPSPSVSNSFRGIPLRHRDVPTRHALAQLRGTIDTDAASEAWDEALRAPAWERPGVWLHGDLQVGNLLARDGRLDAVIDFGCLCVGDPACDVMAAWTYLTGETRETFRAQLSVDDATWARGRGWALSMGLIALPYYRGTNPVFTDVAQRMVLEVLADRH